MQVDPAMVGSTLENYPLKTLLVSLAEGIAEAQSKLDEGSIRTASQLIDKKISIKDANGRTIEKSLLELGFMPTFYHFDSATIKVSVTITMKVEESTSLSVGASLTVGHNTNSNQNLPNNSGTSTTGGEATDTPTNPTDTPTNPTDTPTNPTDTPTNPTDTPTNPTDTPTNPTDTPTNPAGESVKIGTESYTLEQLQTMNLGNGEDDGLLKSLGKKVGLIYKASENGNTAKERRENFGKKVFDAAQAG